MDTETAKTWLRGLSTTRCKITAAGFIAALAVVFTLILSSSSSAECARLVPDNPDSPCRSYNDTDLADVSVEFEVKAEMGECAARIVVNGAPSWYQWWTASVKQRIDDSTNYEWSGLYTDDAPERRRWYISADEALRAYELDLAEDFGIGVSPHPTDARNNIYIDFRVGVYEEWQGQKRWYVLRRSVVNDTLWRGYARDAIYNCGMSVSNAPAAPPASTPVIRNTEELRQLIIQILQELGLIEPPVVEPPVENPPAEAPSEITITFGDLNWDRVQVQNRISQYIIEKGYGYSTDTKLGSSLPLLQGLRNGDTDILMEVWLPYQNEVWNEALAAGEVASMGLSLGTDWQSAFVIPKYLQEQYPELDSVEDLKDERYKTLFQTEETRGKARLVSCIIGWACEEVNSTQITAYGLDDHVHIVNPGDGVALNADLYGAYKRKEPWLGYQWGTNAPALELDLVRLEEPPYTDECWLTTKACAYQDATILIAVNSDLPAKAPDVATMLRNWDFNVENIYKAVVLWQSANPDANTEDAAIWWLDNNSAIWDGWVTDEAAVSIQAALDAGETAAGWPVE